MVTVEVLTGAVGWVTLALGAGLLGGDRQRRIGGAGLLVLGLGLAASRVGAARAEPDPGFLTVNGGLILLGLGLLVAAAVVAPGERRRFGASVAIAAGAASVGWHAAGELAAAGVPRAVAAGVALGLAGAGLLWLGRAIRFAGPVRAIALRVFGPPLVPEAPRREHAWSAAAAAAGSIAVALGPHLAAIFAGAMLAGWAGWLAWHSQSPRHAPIAPVLTLALLPAYLLLATIAGPVGLRTDALPGVPISPAAESLVAAALLLAGWSTAGLWPLHRQLPGALLGAAGAVLLVRAALPLTPGGLEQWRPLAVPLLVIGMSHAAAHGRWALLAMGGGFLGLLSPGAIGVSGAWWLIGTALALELTGMALRASPAATLVRAAGWVTGAWGGWSVLEGSLRGEVVYSAVGAVAIALLVLGGRFDSSHGRVHIWPDDPT